MYNVQCTMYNVQCTMYNVVQCTMYNVHKCCEHFVNSRQGEPIFFGTLAKEF